MMFEQALSRLFATSTQETRGGVKTERLIHGWTAALFGVLAIVAGGKQYFGNPIDCWCPGEFTYFHGSYSSSYCFYANSYYLPLMGVPRLEEPKKVWEINIYQWFPLILTSLCLMTTFPFVFLRFIGEATDTRLQRYITLSRNCLLGKKDETETAIAQLTADVQSWLWNKEEIGTKLPKFLRRLLPVAFLKLIAVGNSSNIRAKTIITKLVFAANSVGQIVFLHKVLGLDFNMMAEWGNATPVNYNSPFPAVILCDFEVRRLGNLPKYTIQCTIPINHLNAKIFLLVRCWVLLVAIATCTTFVSTMMGMLLKASVYRYAKDQLRMRTEVTGGYAKEMCRSFSNDYLRDDGVFVLKLIARSSSEGVACEVLEKLWNGYKTRCYDNKEQNLLHRGTVGAGLV